MLDLLKLTIHIYRRGITAEEAVHLRLFNPEPLRGTQGNKL
jgi:hypothetical protein